MCKVGEGVKKYREREIMIVDEWFKLTEICKRRRNVKLCIPHI